MLVGHIQKVPHSSQAVAVCRELVFDALVVSNVWEDGVENSNLGGIVTRDEQPALNHHLKQSNRFHGNALSACIRSADDEHALSAVELNVLGQRLLSRGFVGQLEEGMKGRKQMKPLFFSNLW